jgi:hypothetical protein
MNDILGDVRQFLADHPEISGVSFCILGNTNPDPRIPFGEDRMPGRVATLILAGDKCSASPYHGTVLEAWEEVKGAYGVGRDEEN